MRSAETRALSVRDGWAALEVLYAEIERDDPKELRMLTGGRRWSPEEIHDFVKMRVKYLHGEIQRWATPLRTLQAGFGDCGNSSRATIALARLMGYEARLRVFVRDYKSPGLLGKKETWPAHVSAEIWDPKTGRWENCEAAIAARYGEPTLEAAARLGVYTTIREMPPEVGVTLGRRPERGERLRPMTGSWPWRGRYPKAVRLVGTVFRKSGWAWPRKGVVAQYREARPTGSLHLMVYRGGSFVVDHRDAVNPDEGSAVEHLVKDVLRGPSDRAPRIGQTSTQVAATATPISVSDMWQVMSAGFAAQTGMLPSTEQLSVVMAQWMLETNSGAQMIQWNVGNIKHVSGDGQNYATYQTSECQGSGTNCSNQSASFVAYSSLADGVNAYFSLFFGGGRYASAWPAVMAGDVSAFATLLRAEGYYTASESSYAQGMQARITQLQALNLGGPSLPLNCIPNYLAFMSLLALLWTGGRWMGWIPKVELDPALVTKAKLWALVP